jgi:ABC-type transport system involved in cytochrome c biogenesis ATPase subunit
MIEIVIKNFGSENTQNRINLEIKKADLYEIDVDKENRNILFLTIASLCDRYQGDILLNNLSIKSEKIVKRYLQKHTLIISDNNFLFSDLTVRENISIISKLWSTADLSEMVLEVFNFQDIAYLKAKDITEQQSRMLSLSRIVSCPSHFWLINKEVLPEEKKDKEIIDNAMNIRIKQNGAIVIL